MINNVLVAVEDTPEALRAAVVAAELAHRLGARLRIVNVLQDGVLAATVQTVSHEPAVVERRERNSASVLLHATELAAVAGVSAEASQQWGAPGPQILAEAADCGADLIVLGRSGRRTTYADGVGASVVEFSEVPVLLVP